MNHAPMIQMVLDLRDDHGVPTQLNVGDYQPFSGTLGEYIEKVQYACQAAVRAEMRQYVVALLERGIQVPCPVCDVLLKAKDTVDGPELAHDLLMCDNCRYA